MDAVALPVGERAPDARPEVRDDDDPEEDFAEPQVCGRPKTSATPPNGDTLEGSRRQNGESDELRESPATQELSAPVRDSSLRPVPYTENAAQPAVSVVSHVVSHVKTALNARMQASWLTSLWKQRGIRP